MRDYESIVGLFLPFVRAPIVTLTSAKELPRSHSVAFSESVKVATGVNNRRSSSLAEAVVANC